MRRHAEAKRDIGPPPGLLHDPATHFPGLNASTTTTSALLYTRRFDGFCLVTSDSDFTGLATRIREEGLVVLGFGEQKPPDGFRNACNKFVLTELLRPAPAESTPDAAKPESLVAPALPLAAAVTQAAAPSFPQGFMRSALDQSSDGNGWAHLGTFGSYLTKLQLDFDSRVYGFRKRSDLVRSRQDIFVTEERAVPGQAQKQLYLKPR
ncbi:OST-HTH/LOTUS domain-containing protein [Cupriavidus sp. PET2-C1]